MMSFKEKYLNPEIMRISRKIDWALGLAFPMGRVDTLHMIRAEADRDFHLWRLREKMKAASWGLLAAAGIAAVVAVPELTVAVLAGAAVAATAGAGLMVNGFYRSNLVDDVALNVDTKLAVEIGDTMLGAGLPSRDLGPVFKTAARKSFDRMVEAAQAQPAPKPAAL